MERSGANVSVTSGQTTIAFRNATANAWGSSFLRHLQRGLESLTVAARPAGRGTIAGHAQALFNNRSGGLTDPAAHTVLGLCCLMSAAYRGLSDALGSPNIAFELVERSVLASYQDFIRNVCQPLWMHADRSSDTLGRMNFRTWSESMAQQPDPLATAPSRLDGTGYERCLNELGEPALAEIIRRADQAWMDAVAAHGVSALDQRRAQVATDRGGLMDTGFRPFRFSAKPASRGRLPQEVVLELQIHLSTDRRRRASSERRSNWGGAERRRSMRRSDDTHARF